jgi:purine nucleosidase/pyrimidine-specific ribonucleoside hydrolase
MPRPIVIDTDPGLDDAVAILYALSRTEAFDLRGITTVAGNIGLATTTRNAGRLLALMGRADVPVIAGADRPLARPGIDETRIHGADGLGGVALPEPLAPAQTDAPGWLARLLAAEPVGTIDLLCLGPLTNLALLLRHHPGAARRLRRVIAMGGAVDEPGNVGPRTEFNLASDPEATAVVLAAGLDLVLVPLDVTRKVRAARADLARMAGAGPAARTSGALIAAYFDSTRTMSKQAESRPLHDPCVMLLADRPDLFLLQTRSLAVDCRGEPGALIPGPHRVNVALGVDGPAALAALIDGLA